MRTVIHEMIVDLADSASDVVLTIHRTGGVHTELRVPHGKRGQPTCRVLVDYRKGLPDPTVSAVKDEESEVSGHVPNVADRTVVIRSVPLLLVEGLATVASYYSFSPLDVKGVLLCALALLVTGESFVGTRFTFQPNSLRVMEHLGRWPYRISYSDIGQVTQECIGRRLYLKVAHRKQDVTIGGWRSYVFPHVQKRVDEIRKELEWRVLKAKS
jgi:hypothetical protein